MELKLGNNIISYISINILLIVPYGIEIWQDFAWRRTCQTFNCTLWNWNYVSIVDCMRTLSFNCTLWNWNNTFITSSRISRDLLIVPYGIEITKCLICIDTSLLLIVPYGIEMTYNNWLENGQYPFNCTLWNWNTTIRHSQTSQQDF